MMQWLVISLILFHGCTGLPLSKYNRSDGVKGLTYSVSQWNPWSCDCCEACQPVPHIKKEADLFQGAKRYLSRGVVVEADTGSSDQTRAVVVIRGQVGAPWAGGSRFPPDASLAANVICRVGSDGCLIALDIQYPGRLALQVWM